LKRTAKGEQTDARRSHDASALWRGLAEARGRGARKAGTENPEGERQ
jgi:hypothetical protein